MSCRSRRADAIIAIVGFGDANHECVPVLVERMHDADVSPRVRAVIACRLEASRPAKQAVRRGLAVLSRNPAAAARVTARTTDAIWHAAGDRSADWNWYTKRTLLAGIYGATLLYWLRDDSEGDAATLAFLDRRLAGVGRIGRLRRRFSRSA